MAMKPIFIVSLLGLLTLGMSACSTRSVPAGVTDANNMGSEAGVQTGAVQGYAVNGEDNSFNNELQAGPHQGLLGKRRFYFAFNSDKLNQDAYPALQHHADYLNSHPNIKVLLEGNTDSRGSREYNIALGQRRADTVKKQLIADGASSAQISTVSYGAERPIALGDTKADYAKNRRTDLVYESN